MADMALFGDKWTRIENALYSRERVQQSIASNVANAETPKYQRDESTFGSIYAAMAGKNAEMANTQPGHISTSTSGDSRRIFDAPFQTSKSIVNNVDIQQEMERLAQNQLMHELTVQLINKKLTGLKDLIREAK
ncbi:MAG: flagellar basal body rod protein FlgB [Zetaproteobacteria bacterium]|nr:flagellar basal body rod protein FlgB [Zetaproteobacteria bacterium]